MLHVRIIHRGADIQRVKITDDAGRPIDFECTTHDLAQPPARFCEHCGAGPQCIVCGRDDLADGKPFDLPGTSLAAAIERTRERLGIRQDRPTDPTDLLTIDQ